MKKSMRVRAFVPALSVLSLAVAASVQAQQDEVNPIVITATKYEVDTQRVPAFVHVITRQQIDQVGVGSVSEAVMRLAGVPGSPSLYGGNEYSLDMMGFGDTAAGNMVVVIDGVAVREGDQSEIRLSSIPIDAVERIEVQRGGAGVLYGEGATAGVIHIVTRASAKNSPTSHTGTASVTFGSYNTREYRAYANYVNDSLDLSFSALDRKSNGYRVNSKSDQQNGALSLKYSLTDQTRYGFSLMRDDVYSLTPGSLTVQEYRRNPQAAQATSLANKTNMGVKVDRYAFFLESELAGYKVRFDAVERQRIYDALGVLYGAVTPLNFDATNHTYGLSARRSSQSKGYANTWVMGAETTSWDQDRVYPSQPSWGTVKLSSNAKAVYVKNDLDLIETNTRITAGIRSETFDRNQLFMGFNTEMNKTVKAWELGVSQKINQENALYVRTAQSYRLPNLDELPTPVYVGVYPDSVAIPLKPQFEKSYEAGWKFNTATVNSSLRAYQSEFSDEIVYDPAQYGNLNIPKTQRNGVDAVSRFQLNRQLGLMVAYSHRHSVFVAGANSGKDLPMAPKNLLTVRGDWRLDEHQTIGLGWMHVAEQYIAGDFANQYSMPSYRVVDARYGYQMGASDVSLVIRNLLDTKYYSYATTTGGYSLYPDPGRSLMLTLRHKF